MRTILFVLSFFFSVTSAQANQLILSDGYDIDIKIDYTVFTIVSGSNGGCSEAVIERMQVVSRSGHPIYRAEALFDSNPNWLHTHDVGAVRSHVQLVCSGHQCVFSNVDRGKLFHGNRFVFVCSGPAGYYTYGNYAKFKINDNVILDPYAEWERKSAFQLNFGY
ncbi:MAG: hypothetical protein KDD61_11825 [Bdellovibrionales bacterium]|nr:hypothetical protein [Bdellovibrionales bacterium]